MLTDNVTPPSKNRDLTRSEHNAVVMRTLCEAFKDCDKEYTDL